MLYGIATMLYRRGGASRGVPARWCSAVTPHKTRGGRLAARVVGMFPARSPGDQRTSRKLYVDAALCCVDPKGDNDNDYPHTPVRNQ